VGIDKEVTYQKDDSIFDPIHMSIVPGERDFDRVTVHRNDYIKKREPLRVQC
jgi:hypothetical protein